MMRPTLPSRPDDLWLAAFGLAVAGLAGLLMAVGGWLLDGVNSGTAAGASALTTAVIGLGSLTVPRALSRPYAAWNRLARVYVRIARHAVLAASYYTVFTLVGLAGSRLQLSRPRAGASQWARRPAGAHGRGSRGGHAPAAEADEKWLRRLLSWSGHADQGWVLCLVPFVFLCRALAIDTEEPPPGDIYTLY